MRLILLTSLVLLFLVPCRQVSAYIHPGGMHPIEQIAFVKSKLNQKEQPYYGAYQQLLAHAGYALQHQPHALADFNVPGYYKDAQGHQERSKILQQDAYDAYACALAYQLSGKKKYADKALVFLMAWAKTNKSYSDADGSLVMAYSGTAMIMAAELLYNYKGWKQQDRQSFLTWVKVVYRKAAFEIRHRKNNWADWGRLGALLTAYLLDDKTDVTENIRLIQSDLSHKIAPDGHMPEEVKRQGNGIWYTYFSLAPITAACWVAYQAEGVNLFTWQQEGRSLKAALDYLFYFNQHPNEWKWFENPRPGSASAWPGNLLEAMHGIFQEEKYGHYVRQARPLAYPSHHFAWSFPTLMKPLLQYAPAADGSPE